MKSADELILICTYALNQYGTGAVNNNLYKLYKTEKWIWYKNKTNNYITKTIVMYISFLTIQNMAESNARFPESGSGLRQSWDSYTR